MILLMSDEPFDFPLRGEVGVNCGFGRRTRRRRIDRSAVVTRRDAAQDRRMTTFNLRRMVGLCHWALTYHGRARSGSPDGASMPTGIDVTLDRSRSAAGAADFSPTIHPVNVSANGVLPVTDKLNAAVIDSQFHFSATQSIGNDRTTTQALGGSRDHRAEQQAEKRVEHSGAVGVAGSSDVPPLGQQPAGSVNTRRRNSCSAHQCDQSYRRVAAEARCWPH